LSMTSEKAVLAFTGDVMFGRGVNEMIGLKGAGYPWGDMTALLGGADLRLINLECVIAADGRPWSRTPKTFLFRADPIAIESLKLAGVDFVALANNHSLDFEAPALSEMVDRLDAAGIARAGAGRDLREATRPALLDAAGLTVAVISLTDNEPQWAAGPGRPGVNYFPITLEAGNFGRIQALITEAGRSADLTVMTTHWGPNMVEAPSSGFRRFARAAIDAGVDIFHGHSAHIFQGIEVYREKLIMYDTGDFVDDYAIDPELRNDLSFLFMVTVTGGRPAKVEMVPVLIDDCQATQAIGRAADNALTRMARACGRLRTPVERGGERLVVSVSGEPLRKAA